MQPQAPTMPAPAQNSGQALQNVQQFQQGMQSPDAALQEAQSKLGTQAAQQQVTGLRSAITNTTQLLNQVAPSVQGRTQNSLVTSAQADRQVANESAPISANLNQEQQGYNTANANYTDLQSQAESQANANLSSENNQLSQLQNIYGDLYKQEQDRQAQQVQQQQFEEQLAAQREATRASAGSGNLFPGLTTPTPSNPQPQSQGAMKLKGSNGASGYAFTDASGSSINAGQYARLNGIPIGTLLKQMAQSGDKYAGQAYNEIQANLDYYNANPKILASEFAPLFGGM